MKKIGLILAILVGVVSNSFAVSSSSCYDYSNKKCYYDNDIAVKYALDNLSNKKWAKNGFPI